MGLNDAIDLILDWRVLGCGKLEPWKKRFNTKQDAFNMEGCRYKLRVVRYHEQWEEKGGKSRTFYVACNDTGNGRLPGVM